MIHFLIRRSIETGVKRLFGVILFLFSMSAVFGQTTIWSESISATSSVGTTRSVVRMGTGDYVSASKVGSNNASVLRVIRHDATNGDAVWTANINKGRANDVNDIVYDANTGAIFVAMRASSNPTTTSTYHLDWFIVRLNGTTGAEEWTYTFNGSATDGNDEVTSIALCPDGNIVGVGNAEGGIRARVAKVNGRYRRADLGVHGERQYHRSRLHEGDLRLLR
ncbi:MAG: hypothetical protein QM755_21495 [Luteolibacter sp.]